MKTIKFTAILVVLALTISVATTAQAAGTTTVKPSAMNGWGFLLETGASGAGDFVSGPDTAPLSIGGVHFTTGNTSDGILIGMSGYGGTKLSDITTLQYSTYQSLTSSSTVQVTSLQFNIDDNITDTDISWKGRLVFEPYYSETVVNGSWQTWDTLTQGRWWATKLPMNSICSMASPCSWVDVLTNFPNAGIHSTLGAVLFKAGSGWPAGFDGNVDAFTIGVSGDDTTYDFEPEPLCTTVCYVDEVSGNDANGGASAGNAKKTIQAAIDAVGVGGEVRVLPGNYSETATNRFVLGTNGPHQFGLFIDKDGITVQGVDAGDVPITDYNALGAYVTTNATNNFGASGIFVEGDNVTIAGLRIGPNTPGDNKTIEIIGDGFTLKDSHVDVTGGGSVYFNDWQFDTGTDTSHVQSYTIDHNLIDQSTSIDLTSGAGYSGPVSGRQIVNNEFENSEFWPSISFNGSGTGVPWFVQSVGGAVIENNTFTNTFDGNDVRAGHIRIRGDYDNSQFDWTAYWNNNTFNKAVVILVGAYPPFDVREYNYTSGSYSFDVRRIGVNIQGSVDKAVAGDTVLVRDGTYAESPNINKPLTLKSWMGRDVTMIQLQSGPTYLGALTIDGAAVTVDGFTILGVDGTPSTLASTNIYVTGMPDDVDILNNRLKVGEISTSSNGDDGLGLITTYSETSDVENLTVTGNIFEPLNTAGTRAFYINPGVNHFLFKNNSIVGKFNGRAMTQAKDGIIEENTVTGVGAAGSRSSGLGTWGYPDPSVYGKTVFRNNSISGANRAIAVYETDNVTVENNFFFNNGVAIWVGQSAPLAFDISTIHINKNSIINSDNFGVENGYTSGVLDAEKNWWGSATGPAHASNPAGTGDAVSDNVDFNPWLCNGTDTSPATGFQPNLATLCGNPAPAACLVYGVQDTGGSNSQFFTLDPDTATTANLGPLYTNWNFETLDIDPFTGIIYTATGPVTGFSPKGNLFKVDGVDGSLIYVGVIGQRKIEALSFRPTDGVLWGWSSGKGLVTINTTTGAAALVKSSGKEIKGMAWNNAGTLLYLAEEKTLYAYNPANGKITTVARNLPGYVEALEMRPDGLLVLGVHGRTTLYAYNPLTKKVVPAENITGLPYNDIEGIGWPACIP